MSDIMKRERAREIITRAGRNMADAIASALEKEGIDHSGHLRVSVKVTSTPPVEYKQAWNSRTKT